MGKTKGSAAFPASRIKKIIQHNEDIGKVAQSTPIVVCKALEEFLRDLVQGAATEAQSRRQNKVTSSHFKAAVLANPTFDFLKSQVAGVQDLGAYDPDAEEAEPTPKKARKPRKDKGIPKGKRTKKPVAEAEVKPEVAAQGEETKASDMGLGGAPQVDIPVLASKLDQDDEDYDA